MLYIVPWKKADIGDLVGRPANSLLDEVLTPVDREVFRRQTDYFTKLNAEAGAAGRSAAPRIAAALSRHFSDFVEERPVWMSMQSIVRFFQGGGEFMFPIALVGGAGPGDRDRALHLSLDRRVVRNRSLWNDLSPLLAQGDFKRAVAITSKSSAAIGTILNYGLARIQSARRRDDIEKAMEESLMEIVPRLEKRTHYLGTFANMATLLGLLGTVIGLIARSRPWPR